MYSEQECAMGKAVQQCTKCKKHGINVSVKDHKIVCPFRTSCGCNKCEWVDKQRSIRASQTKHRRHRKTLQKLETNTFNSMDSNDNTNPDIDEYMKKSDSQEGSRKYDGGASGDSLSPRIAMMPPTYHPVRHTDSVSPPPPPPLVPRSEAPEATPPPVMSLLGPLITYTMSLITVPRCQQQLRAVLTYALNEILLLLHQQHGCVSRPPSPVTPPLPPALYPSTPSSLYTPGPLRHQLHHHQHHHPYNHWTRSTDYLLPPTTASSPSSSSFGHYHPPPSPSPTPAPSAPLSMSVGPAYTPPPSAKEIIRNGRHSSSLSPPPPAASYTTAQETYIRREEHRQIRRCEQHMYPDVTMYQREQDR